MSHHVAHGKILEGLEVTTRAHDDFDASSEVFLSTHKAPQGRRFDGRADREGFSFQLTKIQELTMDQIICHGAGIFTSTDRLGSLFYFLRDRFFRSAPRRATSLYASVILLFLGWARRLEARGILARLQPAAVKVALCLGGALLRGGFLCSIWCALAILAKFVSRKRGGGGARFQPLWICLSAVQPL